MLQLKAERRGTSLKGKVERSPARRSMGISHFPVPEQAGSHSCYDGLVPPAAPEVGLLWFFES